MKKELEETGEHAKGMVVATDTISPTAQPKTLMEMASYALQRGDGLDVIEKLMDLNDRYEAKEAKKAFLEAKAKFKTNAPVIEKDLKNTQYNSRYTSKGNLINTAAPALGEYGLDTHFDISQTPDQITVTCILTHIQGHSESVTMNAPPDKSGSKNPIQQIKATKTYLEIATFESVTGLASKGGSLDDDGNIVGEKEPEPIRKDQTEKIEALKKETKPDAVKFVNQLQKDYKKAAVDRLDEDQADDLIKRLQAKADYLKKKEAAQ